MFLFYVLLTVHEKSFISGNHVQCISIIVKPENNVELNS